MRTIIALLVVATVAVCAQEVFDTETAFLETIQPPSNIMEAAKHLKDLSGESFSMHTAEIAKHVELIQRAKAYKHNFGRSKNAIRLAVKGLVNGLVVGHAHDERALKNAKRTAARNIKASMARAVARAKSARSKACPSKERVDKASERKRKAKQAMLRIKKTKVCPVRTTWAQMNVNRRQPTLGSHLRRAWAVGRAKYVRASHRHVAARKALNRARRAHATVMTRFRTSVRIGASNSHRTCTNAVRAYAMLNKDVQANVGMRKRVYMATLFITCYVDALQGDKLKKSEALEMLLSDPAAEISMIDAANSPKAAQPTELTQAGWGRRRRRRYQRRRRWWGSSSERHAKNVARERSAKGERRAKANARRAAEARAKGERRAKNERRSKIIARERRNKVLARERRAKAIVRERRNKVAARERRAKAVVREKNLKRIAKARELRAKRLARERSAKAARRERAGKLEKKAKEQWSKIPRAKKCGMPAIKKRANTSRWNIAAGRLPGCASINRLKYKLGPVHWRPTGKTCGKKGGSKPKVNPKTGKVCNSRAGPICHGYNLRCWRTSLSKCKAACKKDRRCNLAEYKARGTHCCTSKIATKKACPGKWAKASGWIGYNIC